MTETNKSFEERLKCLEINYNKKKDEHQKALFEIEHITNITISEINELKPKLQVFFPDRHFPEITENSTKEEIEAVATFYESLSNEFESMIDEQLKYYENYGKDKNMTIPKPKPIQQLQEQQALQSTQPNVDSEFKLESEENDPFGDLSNFKM